MKQVLKNKELKLDGAHYAKKRTRTLYWKEKLFTVNTGHATQPILASTLSHKTIDGAF